MLQESPKFLYLQEFGKSVVTKGANMSKSKQPKQPKYCLHKPSGRGYVELGGKQRYLPGKHGSKESVQEYEKLVGEYLANGRKLPSESQPTLPNVSGVMKCRELALKFLDWSKFRYDEKGHSHCWAAMFFLTKYFGDLPVDDFIPVSLEYLQERMAAEMAVSPGEKGKRPEGGYARLTINRHIAIIKRAFRRGVANRWVNPVTHYALQSVETLKKGQRVAGIVPPEHQKVPPVDIDDFKKTLPSIKSNVVRDMARVQLLCGMRPQDVCNMRLCDIDRRPRPDGMWKYTPYTHKTAHRDKVLEKAINPQAQAILVSYLLANEDSPEAFLFSPKESMQQQSIDRRKNRKTLNKKGDIQPSQRNRRKENRKREPGDRYLVSSYYHAIVSACDRAGVPRWYPNQLRHTAGTVAKNLCGTESAQVFLGHEHLSTTEIYAEKNFDEAAGVALKVGEFLGGL